MQWYLELYSENAGYKKLSSDDGNLPANWRDFAFEYLRSEKYTGVIRSFSVKAIDFVKDGKTFLDSIIKTYGVTEVVRVLIWHKANDSTFSVFYSGVLDLTTYESDRISFSCGLIDSDFVQKIRSREDQELDVNRTTTIDGEAIATHVWKTALLKARGISTPGKSESLFRTVNSSSEPLYVTPTEDNKNVGMLEPDYLLGKSYYYKAYEDTEIVTSNIEGIFSFDQNGLGSELTFTIDITHYDIQGVEILTTTVFEVTTSADFGDITFTGSTVQTNMNQGEYLMAHFGGGDIFGDDAGVYYPTGGIKITVGTIERSKSTYAKFDFPFPIFDRMLWLLTGKENTLRSTALGSSLDGYTSNGKAWNYGLTCGYLLRLIEKYPAFNFSDLFDSYARIFNLGMGFEREGQKRVVRIEEKEYFFQRTKVITLTGIKDFKESYAENYVNNSYGVGYEDQDFGEFGGQNEFNQKLNFSNKLTSKSTLNLLSPFRADGLGVELQRRAGDTDDDADGDASNFIISMKDDGGYTNTAPADLGVTDILGIADPDTAYNIEISPKHILKNWGNWIRSALDKFKTENIAFASSEKNIGLNYTEDGGTVDEDGDITINTLSRPIFEPVKYSFTCPLTSAQINTIEANPNGIIQFSYDSVDYYGFLTKMTIKIADKQANFELLKTYKFVG